MTLSLNSNQPYEKLSQVWPHFTQIEVDSASGAYLYDQQGNKYLDFTSGIGVTNTGHCHPRVVRAIQNQAEKLLHGQATIVYHRPMLELVEELESIMPSTLNSYFFTNSGSEAVESAIKLARHATGKANIIAFQGGYHGRTIGALSLTTAKTVYRSSYQPLMSGVHVAPFPYPYRYQSLGMDSEILIDWCLNELRNIIKTQSSPEETAALLLEPILGEGGYVIPPTRFIRELRKICDEYGILLIFDEVQTGFGRTGKFFAMEHFDVCPDILVIAKGLASGLPLSGIVANQELMERWKVGSHGGTYGGNPLACAAAVETIRVIKDEKLVKNADVLGKELVSQLKEIAKEHPEIAEVRGLGLMVGCEFKDSEWKSHSLIAKEVRERCLARGLLLLTCGTYDHIIRWIPPLTVTSQQIKEAVMIFRDELGQLLREE